MVNATTPTTCIYMGATSDGTWTGGGPIHFAVPLLILQLVLVQVVARVLHVLFTPLRQPRVISEILSGVVLGPSVMGYIPGFSDMIFPKNSSLTVISVMAFLGLVFFLFTVGLDMDLKVLKRTSGAAFAVGATGVAVPFTIGIGVSFAAKSLLHLQNVRLAPFLIFMGTAMSITALPVLAIILRENKLLATDIGQMAMSAATVNDVIAWTLLALALALSSSTNSIIILYIAITAIAFIVIMWVVVKPFMAWVSSRVNEYDPIPEWITSLTLLGLLCSGFTTDTIGVHIIFGAFLFGLIIPSDTAFARRMIEKVDTLNITCFLPFFFAQSGLLVKLEVISGRNAWLLVVLVLFAAIAGKVGGTIGAAMLNRIPFRQALVLGMAMNTKGVVELIVLNIGYQRKVINEELYTIMVVMALITTFMTSPIVMLLYSPSMQQLSRGGRKVEGSEGRELRLVLCVRGKSPSSATLNLVELLRGAGRGFLHVFTLNIVEKSEKWLSPSQIGLSSATKLLRKGGDPAQGDEEQPVAFVTYGSLNDVRVMATTATSRFNKLHEEMCDVAGTENAQLVILPFDNFSTPAALPSTMPSFASVIHRIAATAPCSVATFVNGSSGEKQVSPADVALRIAVFFFGGADDREALAVGLRISEHPGVKVSIIRFLPANEEEVISAVLKQQQLESPAAEKDMSDNASLTISVARLELNSETDLNEAAIARVKQLASLRPHEISFVEKVTDNPFEAAMVTAGENFDMVVLGKGRTPSPLLAVSVKPKNIALLEESNTHNEKVEALGPVGAVLADSPDLQVALLVLQQYDMALVKTGVQLRREEKAIM